MNGTKYSSESEGKQEESEKELLASLSVVMLFFNYYLNGLEFSIDYSLLFIRNGSEIGSFRDIIVMKSLKLISLNNHLLIIPEFNKLIS